MQPIIIIKCKHMKTKTFTLLSSLTLLLTLFLGTAEVKADTVVVDGNSISDEWTNGGVKGFTVSTGTISYAASAFSTFANGIPEGSIPLTASAAEVIPLSIRFLHDFFMAIPSFL